MSRCIWALRATWAKTAVPSWPASFRCIWLLFVLTETCFIFWWIAFIVAHFKGLFLWNTISVIREKNEPDWFVLAYKNLEKPWQLAGQHFKASSTHISPLTIQCFREAGRQLAQSLWMLIQITLYKVTITSTIESTRLYACARAPGSAKLKRERR